jgi:hypothetical protein
MQNERETVEKEGVRWRAGGPFVVAQSGQGARPDLGAANPKTAAHRNLFYSFKLAYISLDAEVSTIQPKKRRHSCEGCRMDLSYRLHLYASLAHKMPRSSCNQCSQLYVTLELCYRHPAIAGRFC